VDYVEMVLEEIEWRGMKWIDMAQYMNLWMAFMNVVMNLRIPKNSGRLLSRSDWRLLKKDSAP
jgi:hypothetical protein